MNRFEGELFSKTIQIAFCYFCRILQQRNFSLDGYDNYKPRDALHGTNPKPGGAKIRDQSDAFSGYCRL